ncbi:SDR family oxidoreductase [Flagellimonas nanhaiensis]|uniref:SDR family NAD(P)-dependent oxidoreductase n=1 Tax=Flagellimonas nanhaiensis TaxID=2292706 RepID=A0A371JRZ7_9FLAO|nr:SDR family oxidoreductase [Allomuricauda nanhaiensis]RDY60290.1 SDR family NAD(P)-dependent oxidoreductase [Allomuricauda nanhaiensis]
MTSRIGVLGCGWLGLPLAECLVSRSYEVHGTTTSLEKQDVLRTKGIQPYIVELSEKEIKGDIQKLLSNIDVLIINIPPRLRGSASESYVTKMTLLHEEIRKSRVQKIVFVSSTSVYGMVEGEITETTLPEPSTESGRQLLVCEKIFSQDENLSCTLIRFGGLIGPSRHPVTMLSKRQNLSNGNHPINLIHLEDCIHMICTILEKDYWGKIFNGVYPSHPSKREYYGAEAKSRGIPIPNYLESSNEAVGKIVLSKNFLDLGHKFQKSIFS